MRIDRLIVATLALGGLTLVPGCSSDSNALARVSGVVKYQNQPLKGGMIGFHDSEGRTRAGEIGEDGSYSIADVPVGELKVTVETESLKQKTPTYGGARAKGLGMADYKPPGSADKPPPDAKESRYVKIPAKYGDVKSTTLSATLTKGKNSKDFDLTD